MQDAALQHPASLSCLLVPHQTRSSWYPDGCEHRHPVHLPERPRLPTWSQDSPTPVKPDCAFERLRSIGDIDLQMRRLGEATLAARRTTCTFRVRSGVGPARRPSVLDDVAVKPATHILYSNAPGARSRNITITKIMITTMTPIMTPMMPLFTLPPLSSVGRGNTSGPVVHEANLAEIADARGYSPQVP